MVRETWNSHAGKARHAGKTTTNSGEYVSCHRICGPRRAKVKIPQGLDCHERGNQGNENATYTPFAGVGLNRTAPVATTIYCFPSTI